MKSRKKQTIILSVIVFILLLGLGFAYLNSNLSINGTTNITSASWNIYWNNVQVSDGSITDIITPATIQSGNTLVVFNVNLTEPGDYYEFTVDAKNDGSIDAMIGDLTQGVYASNGTTPKPLPDYLEYTVTYSDDKVVSQNDLLAHNTIETYKVRVYYKEDINASQLPSTDDSIVFKFGVEYVQANDSATEVNHSRIVYTANASDGNSSTINNGTNTSVVWIGRPISDNIETFPTPELAMDILDERESIGRPLYLKHKIKNGIVSESYIGFLITPEMAQNNTGLTIGTYYLKGKDTNELVGGNWQCKNEYIDANGRCTDTDYNNNKTILLNAFGSSYCTEYTSIFGYNITDFEVSAYESGYVRVCDSVWCCYVYSYGYSLCYVS